MTTMQDLIEDTRRLLYGSMADQLNFLSVEAAEGATTLTMLMDVAPIQQGMVLSAGLNVYYVISVNAGSKTVTVHPAYQNSHNDALPAGQPVMIRPRITDFVLFTYINDVLTSLSSPAYGLYYEGQWTDTDAGWQTVFDIPPEAQYMTGLTRVSLLGWYGTNEWYEIPMTYVEWQPESNTIRLRAATGASSVRFDYKGPFLPADSLATDMADCGVSDTLRDVVALGAAVRVLRTTESRRDQIHAQGDSRRAEEVPVGGNASAANVMNREFEARIAQERARLVNRNPYTLALPR